jgi:hypothetical protein
LQSTSRAWALSFRHIIRRNDLIWPKRRRQSLYPALWAWEQARPVDVKDIRDKRALGTALCDHLAKRGLPRYQWTAVDGLTRLRAACGRSHRINRSNGLAFLALILLHLRALGIDRKVTFQTDWGQEFGGDNPEQVAQLSAKFLAPLGGELSRYPKGCKEYNGRVERSHRADDEEWAGFGLWPSCSSLEPAGFIFTILCDLISGTGLRVRPPWPS